MNIEEKVLKPKVRKGWGQKKERRKKLRDKVEEAS